MSIEQISEEYSYASENEAQVSEELLRLTRKINQIEQILTFSLNNKREVFSVRARLLKAVSERRMTLNFWKEINTEKYLKILKTINLSC